MAGHTQHHAEHHGGAAPDDAGHGHSGPKLYWTFAVILAVLTMSEWLCFKFRTSLGMGNEVLVPLLLGLSAVKFTMVVGWYMHLRYDPGWMKKMFVVALVMGGGTAIVLHLLMGHASHVAAAASGTGA